MLITVRLASHAVLWGGSNTSVWEAMLGLKGLIKKRTERHVMPSQLLTEQ